MIKIKKVSWKNILSFGNFLNELEFNNEKTIISGLNASGKSCLLDIICFGLYGKSYRQIPKPLLVNSINKKELYVKIELDVENNEYTIERGIKPNIFNVYKNNILIEQDAKIKDYQKQLEQDVLKINYDIFTQLVIIGKSNYTQFMKLPLGQRRLLIEELLDLNIFSIMKDILSKKISNLNDEYKDVSNLKNNIESQISITEKYIENEKNRNIETLEYYENDIKEKEKTKQGILSKVYLLEDHSEFLESQFIDATGLNEQLDKLNKLYYQFIEKQKNISKEMEFYVENDICPSCEQDISHIKEHKYPKLESKLNELSNGQDILNKKIFNLKEEISKNNTAIEEYKNNSLTIKNEYATIRHIDDAIKDIEHKQKDIKDSNKEYFNKLLNDLNNLQNDLNDKIHELEKLSNLKIKYADIAPLLKDDGLKSLIIKKYIPIFNKIINKYLGKLGLYIRFELDEEFNEQILSRNYDKFVYNSFSEGQRQRIDLAMLLTWREITKLKNSVNCNLIIFDETLDASLDQSGVDSFIQILSDIKSLNICVISHTPHKLNDFSRSIEVKKMGNFSMMDIKC